ncbi:MAG: Ribonuclease HII [Thermoanaerobacterales bacterium 50_218]|nr:MAG: Ribonuclease HII [Thermoanaerobacterales bacterium 50_218]HAA90216.1 ribonuclease HII [Peptococcaceae bacterium]
MRTIKLDEKEWLRLIKLHFFEQVLWRGGADLVAGVDEAGRGPLAGPVVAAVVVLDQELLIPGLNDSKKVNPGKRDLLAQEIKMKAVDWAVGIVSPRDIEEFNIQEATYQAVRKALKQLSVVPDHLLVDGWAIPGLEVPQTPLVKGDCRSAAIAAASLLAKTTRDELMKFYARFYPEYGFEKHKGYPTKEHLKALQRHGPCPLHRRNFRGVLGSSGVER